MRYRLWKLNQTLWPLALERELISGLSTNKNPDYNDRTNSLSTGQSGSAWMSCYAARDTKIGDLYVLTNGSVLHLRTRRSLKVPSLCFLSIGMCSVITSSHLRQFFHSTRFSLLSLWLNPSPTSSWLKFADGVNIMIICTSFCSTSSLSCVAPTSSTASRANHEEINSWVSFPI